MKIFQSVILGIVTLVTVPCVQAQVKSSVSQSSASRTLTGNDAEYDFDVYVRSLVPTTKYFIVYILEDGSVQEIGPISTYDMAAREIYFNFEHGLAPGDAIDADIVARPTLDPLRKFNRYGTYLEALSIAWQLDALGLETDIRLVHSIQFKAKVASRSRYLP